MFDTCVLTITEQQFCHFITSMRIFEDLFLSFWNQLVLVIHNGFYLHIVLTNSCCMVLVNYLKSWIGLDFHTLLLTHHVHSQIAIVKFCYMVHIDQISQYDQYASFMLLQRGVNKLTTIYW